MKLGRWIVVSGLRIYKCVVSPVLHSILGPFAGCRFHPTCSAYAREAVQRHGVTRGGWLTVVRLAKCQPWGPCGCDPVPDHFREKPLAKEPEHSLSFRD